MAVTYFEATDKVTRANVNTKIDEINYMITPAVLYNNASGTTNTVILSDNVSNYTRIGIYFLYNNESGYNEFYAENLQNFSLGMLFPGQENNYIIFRCAYLNLTSNIISFISNFSCNMQVNGFGYDDTAKIKIFKVVGYK